MKIVHLCLSSFFIDDRLLSRNKRVRQHVVDGHEIPVIASTEVQDDKENIVYVAPRNYIGAEGTRVIRLPYRHGLSHAIARRLRTHPNVFAQLQEIAPDVIMFHGPLAGNC